MKDNIEPYEGLTLETLEATLNELTKERPTPDWTEIFWRNISPSGREQFDKAVKVLYKEQCNQTEVEPMVDAPVKDNKESDGIKLRSNYRNYYQKISKYKK